MSRLDDLLISAAPLEPADRSDLEGWLVVLTHDCELFGAAPEDERRMAQIRRRLNEDQS